MNDTLIFFGLAALALIFKWLTSKAEKSQAENETHESDSAPPRVAPPMRPPPQSEEERVRRFLEALGMPQGTQPPPPVRPRRTVTPTPPPAQRPKVKRSFVQPLPPLVTTPADFSPPPIPSVVTVPPVLPEIETPLPRPRPVVAALRKAAPIPSVPATSLGALLRTPGGVRRAIVLREVLGSPRGLQPFESVGSRDLL